MRHVFRKAAGVFTAAVLAASASPARAADGGSPVVSGDLFYTTFAAPDLTTFNFAKATVDTLKFSYDGGSTPASLTISGQKTLATLPDGQNADGIIFDNAGNLLVGSGGIKVNINVAFLGINVNLNGTNKILSFTQAGVANGSANTPDGPFHETLSPDGKTVFSGGTFGVKSFPFVGPLPVDGDAPGHLVATPSDLKSAGSVVVTTPGAATFTQLAFVPGGKVFYTSSGSAGTGSYGTIDLGTGVVTAIGSDVPSAHGIIFDPFSDSIILTGKNQIAQVNPVTGAITGTRTIGTQLDQGSTDGHGHLFIGDNNGSVAFVDFSKTKDISSMSDPAFEKAVQANLDDLAPLNAVGAPPVTTGGGPPPPPPAVPLPAAGWMGLVMLAGVVGQKAVRGRLAHQA